MELVIDDDRVDGTLEGVVLREVLPKVDALLRSRILRDKEGKLRSSLLATPLEADSTDRRLLGMCDSKL